MAVPASFAAALPQLSSNKTVMFTIGGEDWCVRPAVTRLQQCCCCRSRRLLPRFGPFVTGRWGGRGARWNWTSTVDDAVTMAHEVATWRKRYPGLSGIDIDAENQVEQSDPEVMAAFVRALKEADPGVLVSLCVYGNPEGRALHNYLINNLLRNASFPQVFRQIMAMCCLSS